MVINNNIKPTLKKYNYMKLEIKHGKGILAARNYLYDGKSRLGDIYSEKDAEEIVKRVNIHEELLEAVKPFINVLNQIPQGRIKQGGMMFGYNDANITIEDLQKLKHLFDSATTKQE